MDDLETASLKSQIETLERRWRVDAEQARNGVTSPTDFYYQQGYADALDRVVQALRALEEQW